MTMIGDTDVEPGTATVPQLACRGVDAGYGRIRICRAVDLTVGTGECVALLGPNGAGKTTLLKAVVGATQVGGEVELAGRRLTGQAVHRRALSGVALVPESRGNVFPNLDVHDNLLLAARRWPRHDQAARIERVHDVFPVLSRLRRSKAGHLSGGEQQMLAIAMALVVDPKVILLDEPSQGLAPSVLRTLEASLVALRSTGVTILLAEQNLEVASALADRFLVINHGEIVASGLGADLVDRAAIARAYLTS